MGRILTAQESRRKKKYPDTATFVWENLNPKGNITGDCTFRAIAGATGQSWEEAFDGLTSIERKYCKDEDSMIDEYMKSIGWTRQKQLRRADGTKYTGSQFCRWLNRYMKDGRAVMAFIGTHHATCFKPGKSGKYQIHDIWDCSGKCVGKYWIKE